MSTLYISNQKVLIGLGGSDIIVNVSQESTKMTNKSLARKIAQKWDYNLMIGDLSFLDLSSNSNQQIKPYINDYLIFLSNRIQSSKSFKTARSFEQIC